MNARQELNHRISTFGDAQAPEGVAVALYGSVARGDSTTRSDIDLLVVFPDDVALDGRDEFVTGLRDNVQLWTGNDAQIYDVTETEMAQKQEEADPMVDSWVTDGIVIFGKSVLGMRKAP